MKKLLIFPALLFCMTAATFNRVRAPIIGDRVILSPINTKVDNVNIKAIELNRLIRQTQ